MHGNLEINVMPVVPDEWEVVDPAFRYLVGHRPPRPFGFLYPLRYEIRSYLVVMIWAMGIGAGAASIVLGSWTLALIGVSAFGIWLWLYQRIAWSFRNSPILIGRVNSLARHPLRAGLATASAKVPDGLEVPVVFPAELAARLIKKDGGMDVLFLHIPKAEFSAVLAVRAIRTANHQSGQETT